MKRSDFFIEVLKLMPPLCTVEIWSSGEQLREVLLPISTNGWRPLRFDLSSDAIKALESNKMIDDIPYHFESIEIWNNGNKLFEGFDLLETSTISRTIALPPNFVDAFINMTSNPNEGSLCGVADDW